jgi:hypothetical protein
VAQVTAFRDVATRLRLRVQRFRDVAARFRLRDPNDVSFVVVPSSTLGHVPGASGGSNQHHLIYATNTGRWWFFTFAGTLDSGTATGGSTSQLTDSGKSWTASAYRGASCVILSGPGAGQTFEIGANTATSLPVQNNGDTAPPQPGLPTAVGSGSVYAIVETRKVKAFVSSGSDLQAAPWSLATNGASADPQNQTGADFSAGRNDGGGFGETPGDGRLLAMGYASIASVDVVEALVQQNLHWMKISLRGKPGSGAAGTMAWDSPGATNTNPWDDSFPGNECAPTLLQGLAIAVSTTGRWHAIHHQNSVGLVGYAHDITDNGTSDTLNRSLDWAGSRATFDANSAATNMPHQAALAPLASGLMLAVYTRGTNDGGFGTGVTHNVGLRYVKSTADSNTQCWPTTDVAAFIPSLGTSSQHPNDWGLVGRTTTDVHVVRRDGATTLEHVRYDGTNWGTVTTLPTTGLTGHQAGSGIHLVTDGTAVHCFVVDTDANHSIKRLSWTAGGGWGSSWTAVPSNTNAKAFLSGHDRVVNVGGTDTAALVWTEGSAGAYEVVGTVASLAAGPTTAYRDVTARLRTQVAAWRDVTTRLRLFVRSFRDAAVRTRLLAGAFRDATARIRLWVPSWRDAGARVRLRVQSWRDVGARAALQVRSFRDATARVGLRAFSWRDAGARFNLQSGIYRDAAARVALRVLAYRDATLRLRLGLAGWRDTATRLRLRATAYRDTGTRVRLFVLTYRDTAARLRLWVQGTRDVGTRARLLVLANRDVVGRVRLAVGASRDVATRLRVRIQAYRDVGTRTLVSVGWWRDTRIRLALRAWSWRDATARFLVQTPGLFRDTATRVRLRATTLRDLTARFRVGITVWRDAASRLRLAVERTRDSAARLRLRATATRDATVRQRLRAQSFRDTASRARLGLAAVRDTRLRVRTRAEQWRDAPARYALQVRVWRDAAGRARVQVLAFRDVRGRMRLYVPASRDVGTRFRLRSGAEQAAHATLAIAPGAEATILGIVPAAEAALSIEPRTTATLTVEEV